MLGNKQKKMNLDKKSRHTSSRQTINLNDKILRKTLPMKTYYYNNPLIKMKLTNPKVDKYESR